MSIYEEIEIEDMTFDEANQVYSYPCPCGDKFSISLEDLHFGEDIATCPSCTLRIRVIFDEDKLPDLQAVELEAEIRASTHASETLGNGDTSSHADLEAQNKGADGAMKTNAIESTELDSNPQQESLDRPLS